ncbi:uncharacterized protein METZ01_LOCUS452893, partial [marine metagenome]
MAMGPASIAQLVMTVLAVAVLGGCTNVARMQQAFEEGDDSQIERLIEIVSRQDYPY